MRWTEIHIFEGSKQSPTEYSGGDAKMYLHHRYRGLVNPKKNPNLPGVVLLVGGKTIFRADAVKEHLRSLFSREEHVWVTFDDDVVIEDTQPPVLVRRGSENVINVHRVTAARKSPVAVTSQVAPLVHIVNKSPWLDVVVCDARDVARGPEEGYLGTPGSVIHAKITFDKGNSPRTGVQKVTVAGLEIAPVAPRAAGVDWIFEARVPLDARTGGPGTLRVNLGPAGGDRCKIEIGAEKGVWTDTLFVRNGRRIGIQSLAPARAARRPCLDVVTAAGAIGGPCLTQLNALYRDAFIEFYDHSHFEVALDSYRDALLDGATRYPATNELKDWQGKVGLEGLFASAMSVEATFVKDEDHGADFAAGAAFVPNLGAMRMLRGHLTANTENEVLPPDVIAVEWCDMMFEADPTLPQVDVNFAGPDPMTMDNAVHVLPTSPAAAAPGIAAIAWMLGFRSHNGKVKYVDAERPDDSYGFIKIKEFMGEVGLSVQESEAPLGGYVVLDAADNAAVVELVDSKTWRVTPPAAARALLEKIAAEKPYGTFGQDEWIVVVSVQIEGLQYGPAGISMTATDKAMMPNPVLVMPTYFGTGQVSGLVKTLAHEIAHALGQAYMAKTEDPDRDSFGRTTAMEWLAGGGAEVNAQGFGKVVPDGLYYVGHGHKGNHCSSGIPADLFEYYPRYNGEEVKALVEQDRHCVMWGAGGNFHRDGPPFCATCLFFLRATDCDNLQRDW